MALTCLWDLVVAPLERDPSHHHEDREQSNPDRNDENEGECRPMQAPQNGERDSEHDNGRAE